MAKDLESKIASIFPLLEQQPDAIEKISQILVGEMWENLDYPHKPHHNFRVYNDARCISSLYDVKPWEKVLLEKGAISHDLGRNFVELGLITEEEHGNGSFILAKSIAVLIWDFPEDVADYFAEGVALHIEDVLPKETDRWVRILRDSDRTARLGIGGMMELAWYLGYRDEYINKSGYEQVIEDQLLFDSSLPIKREEIEKYDEKPRKYFDEKVMPWIVKNDKTQQLVDGIVEFTNRIYGVPNYTKSKQPWITEPVSKEAQFLAKPRIISMNRFLIANGFREIEIPQDE